MREQKRHRMGGLTLRRWPRVDSIALLPAADFRIPAARTGLSQHARSIPAWASPMGSLACELRRRTKVLEVTDPEQFDVIAFDSISAVPPRVDPLTLKFVLISD